MNSPTPYMTPETARKLLRLSQERTAALRKKRELYKQLSRIGWPHADAMELAAVGVELEARK